MGLFVLRLSVYLVTLVVLAASLYYDIEYANFEGDTVWNYKGFGGKFKFLTFINMVRKHALSVFQVFPWCANVSRNLTCTQYLPKFTLLMVLCTENYVRSTDYQRYPK